MWRETIVLTEGEYHLIRPYGPFGLRLPGPGWCLDIGAAKRLQSRRRYQRFRAIKDAVDDNGVPYDK
jgi:hypothetical protein